MRLRLTAAARRTGLQGLFAALVLAVLAFSATDSAAQSGYRIQPGDRLQIEVLEDPSLDRSMLVLPDGSVDFPLAGTVRAGGRTVEQLRAGIAAALAPNFATAPTVFVSVASLNQTADDTIPVFILGEVQRPGQLDLEAGVTVLQALAAAGGLTTFAADKRIELIRTNTSSSAVTTYLFNIRVPAGGDGTISGGTKLTSGDVIKIPQRRLFE